MPQRRRFQICVIPTACSFSFSLFRDTRLKRIKAGVGSKNTHLNDAERPPWVILDLGEGASWRVRSAAGQGSIEKKNLIARFGSGIRLPDLREEISCPRTAKCMRVQDRKSVV